MTHAPATHALVNPRRHGLTPVQYVFGELCEDSRDLPVIVGNLVRDTAGVVWVFAGLGADRKPILVADETMLEPALEVLCHARLSHQTVTGTP